ncbi:MAG: right-handed parallel beta-helix repeat-containing protein [Planctomycetota bacterium]
MKPIQALFIALAVAVMLSAVAVVWQSDRQPIPAPITIARSASGSADLSRSVHLIDYLPEGFVRDGSVDYSTEVRAAFAAAANGELVLPNFSVRVSRAQGENWCILVAEPMLVRGSPSSQLVEVNGGVQLLRVYHVSGFTMRDVTLRGLAEAGQALGHGLLQVLGGADIDLQSVRIEGCDADGIAVSQAEGVRISGCRVTRASKSALYVNASTRVRVTDNEVSEFGGHRMQNNSVVGTGIQLSSNRDVVCANNIVQQGTGVGILVNALSGGAAPVGTIITGNRVTDVTNPTNGNVSSGIRLANGSGDGRTQTLVSGNSLRGCGVYGIYIENHTGAHVTGNSVVESERAGIVAASVDDAVISNNVVLNSGTSGLSNFFQVQLINQASRVTVRGNELRDVAAFAAGAAQDIVGDASGGAANLVEPTFERSGSAPINGAGRRGDIALSESPRAGDFVGWVCVQSGDPGVWRPFGRIED